MVLTYLVTLPRHSTVTSNTPGHHNEQQSFRHHDHDPATGWAELLLAAGRDTQPFSQIVILSPGQH